MKALPPVIVRPLLLGTCALVVAALSGCGQGQGSAWTDMAYLTAPAPPMDTIKARGSYFPASIGDHWVLSRSLGNRTMDSECAVVGTQNVGGRKGIIIQTTLAGKVVQKEVYAVTRDAVVRLKTGTNADVTLDPPMPFLALPLENGKEWSWKGRLLVGGKSIPGEQTCRASGPEHIVTPAGSFDTCRVDSVLSLHDNQSVARASLSVWLAPGIGIVRQRTGMLGQVGTSELKSYRIP